ncbi:MAG: hypothetical protein QW638_06385 [Candidatus Bathyarchaeia archaeon]|nr:hypothetical protein [Candidatus Bathyarchaeota archaeon]
MDRLKQILFTVLLLSPLVTSAMMLEAGTEDPEIIQLPDGSLALRTKVPDGYLITPLEPPKTYFLTKIDPAVDIVHEKVQVEPDVWYEYQDVGGTLPPDYYNLYGPKEPYAVSVKINTVSPPGYKVTVIIIVAGAAKWSGLLGAGESSPTITCDDQSTYVKVANDNLVTVTYTGRITWVMH